MYTKFLNKMKKVTKWSPLMFDFEDPDVLNFQRKFSMNASFFRGQKDERYLQTLKIQKV